MKIDFRFLWHELRDVFKDNIVLIMVVLLIVFIFEDSITFILIMFLFLNFIVPNEYRDKKGVRII